MNCGCSKKKRADDIKDSQGVSDGSCRVGSRYRTLRFYNEDDDTYETVIVEPHLRMDGTCEILAIKNGFPKDVPRSIMEYWPDIGLERMAEDFEHILDVYNSMEAYPSNTTRMFLFVINFHKYNMLINPLVFFPSDMVDLNEFSGVKDATASPETLKHLIRKGPDTPPMFSQIWVREPNYVWTKAFLLLKEDKLYLSHKVQAVANFIRQWKNGTLLEGQSQPEVPFGSSYDLDQLHLFASLTDYDIYTTIDAKDTLSAPTEYGICLKPNYLYQTEYSEYRYNSDTIDDPTVYLRCISCESEKARLCWIAAMRLAKYGKQLRENYRSFKKKSQQRDSSGENEEYPKYSKPDEISKSKVAMDFTGNVGRIVEDPQEVKAITELEEKPCKVKIRPSAKSIPEKLNSSKHIIDQPWFHGNLNRDQSTVLINRHGEYDGAFLVRESKSNPGIYVLTFRCKDKIIHSQIQPVIETGCNSLYYTLDGGQTKFHDMIQLIEFYRLNAGCLPTRLTQWVENNNNNNNNNVIDSEPIITTTTTTTTVDNKLSSSVGVNGVVIDNKDNHSRRSQQIGPSFTVHNKNNHDNNNINNNSTADDVILTYAVDNNCIFVDKNKCNDNIIRNKNVSSQTSAIYGELSKSYDDQDDVPSCVSIIGGTGPTVINGKVGGNNGTTSKLNGTAKKSSSSVVTLSNSAKHRRTIDHPD